MLMMHLEEDCCWDCPELLLLFFKRPRMEARINARDVSIAPSRFVRRVLEMSSGSAFGKMEETEMPAALTRISMCSFLEGRIKRRKGRVNDKDRIHFLSSIFFFFFLW